MTKTFGDRKFQLLKDIVQLQKKVETGVKLTNKTLPELERDIKDALSRLE